MTDPPAPRRGEIWLAELDKLRPVVVLTRDPLGQFLHSVIVAPVTSTVRSIATEVAVGVGDGFDVPSVANLDNLTLIDRGRLVRQVGVVQPETLTRICRAVVVAVGCA